MKRIAAILVAVLLCVPLQAEKGKWLVAEATENQSIHVSRGKNNKLKPADSISEEKGGIYAEVGIRKLQRGYFSVQLLVINKTERPIMLEQERIFLLNKYERTMHRYSEYEIKAAWAKLAGSPPPPPPAPTYTYTVEPYGDGYVVREQEDGFRTLGWAIGSLLRRWKNKKRARKQIELIEKVYLRNEEIPSGHYLGGNLDFEAIASSDRTPLTLVMFIAEQRFQFVFSER